MELKDEVERLQRINQGWAELWNHVPRHSQEQARSALAGTEAQRMSDQTERMEDALRRVIGEKIAAEGEAERLRAVARDIVDAPYAKYTLNNVRAFLRSALAGTEAEPDRGWPQPTGWKVTSAGTEAVKLPPELTQDEYTNLPKEGTDE